MTTTIERKVAWSFYHDGNGGARVYSSDRVSHTLFKEPEQRTATLKWRLRTASGASGCTGYDCEGEPIATITKAPMDMVNVGRTRKWLITTTAKAGRESVEIGPVPHLAKAKCIAANWLTHVRLEEAGLVPTTFDQISEFIEDKKAHWAEIDADRAFHLAHDVPQSD